jgi:Rod binding domain-containing protein
MISTGESLSLVGQGAELQKPELEPNQFLGRMTRAKESGDAKEVLKAAREFEAVLLGHVFQEMAKTVQEEDGLFPKTPGSDMYKEWFRTTVAGQWAMNGGIGLGEVLATSMGLSSDEIKGAQAALARSRATEAFTPFGG